MNRQYLAQWAYHHPVSARILLITLELTNAALGLLLGANAWADVFRNGTPPAGLLATMTILLAGAVYWIRFIYFTAGRPLRSKHHYQYALFVANFLLYTTLGGIGAQRAEVFHPSGSVGGSKEVRYEATNPTSPAAPETSDHRVERPEAKAPTDSDRTATRVGYVLLFLAGLVLAYGAAALACNLACAGYGFASVMVLLLGTGILAGGAYFFGRAVDKNMKFYRDMTPEERKREKRRFFRTWGGVLIALILFWLIAFVSAR
ncbi:hypothetical protein GCM10023187_51470 [Nibrella viscosa]|uniref:Uncharacterized protein n=1 Tax=Nibrella viscosa TaxID=1084524 RepID=A0ABP8KXW8_9BACT